MKGEATRGPGRLVDVKVPGPGSQCPACPGDQLLGEGSPGTVAQAELQQLAAEVVERVAGLAEDGVAAGTAQVDAGVRVTLIVALVQRLQPDLCVEGCYFLGSWCLNFAVVNLDFSAGGAFVPRVVLFILTL